MVEIQSKHVPRKRSLAALALWALAAMPVVAAFACSLQKEVPYDSPGGGGPNNTTTGGPNCIGPNCPSQCEANPHPGCKCAVEGQHLLCGKVDATYPDGTAVCGKGVSVCTNGEWGECMVNSAVTLVPDGPPGYWATGFGTGSTCTSNPCDPTCITFDDNGNGLSNDAGIKGTDAGVTLAGDGGTACVPLSCADQGKNCGPVSDHCGGLLNCGTCPAGQTCGGNGVPSVCGAVATCTNLCLQQVVCPSNGTTSLTGKVYAPNGVDPLPNAIVYVPNAAVTPFSTGVTCDNCAVPSGSPLVSTTSGVDGSFTLTNMPVGSNIPLVIQIGRWRRQITIPQITACTVNSAEPTGCGVVISQVYGGGGLTQATYENDFVVLHNKGANAANLSSWSLQYASASGTTWTKIDLSGSIQAGGYYLIKLHKGSSTGSSVSVQDIFADVDIDATNGKVALVSNQTVLSGSCPTANVVDFVGYGAANCSEGSSPVTGLGAKKSANRNGNACTDTNVNSADFAAQTPSLMSGSTTPSICSTCGPLTRFPKNKTEGDIPKMAFVTGKVDGLECVMRKIGIDDSEFTNPSGTGRINFYWGGYAGGTYIDVSTPGEYDLVSSPTQLAKYDMLLFPCQGGQYSWALGDQATFESNIANYANAGGRVFATHYNYIWLYSDGGTYSSPLSPAVAWNINQSNPSPDPQTGYIDQSFPKGQTLAQWLQLLGASTTQGQITINTLRHDFDSAIAPTQRWMYLNDTTGLVISQVYPGGGLAGASYQNDFVVLHNRGGAAVNVSGMSVQVPPSNPAIKISQVYTGGGLSSATYRNDFVSLHNGGLDPVDISTYSLQYAAATGTTWTKVNLSGTIQPGGYYLIKLASGGSTGSNISGGNTDLSATGVDLATTAGKVALVSNQTTLSGACPTAGVLDFFGYGTANCFEGAALTTALASNKSATRVGTGNCTDNNVNSTDFTVGTPTLQSSGSTAATCLGAWQKVNLTGSIPAGGYYLVQLGSSGAVGSALPAADVTDTAKNINTASGTVALVNNQTALTGGCPSGGSIVDLVGYGASGCSEGSPVAALSATTSAQRGGAGCIDNNQNSSDFTASAVLPRSSLTQAVACGTPMHVTFNTPIGAAAGSQCGRVVFSDFHVEDSNNTQYPFPSECPGGGMTPQEKLLEYMLFDLASCVQPDTPPACVPITCAQQGLNCGMAGDGCGNAINCGACTAPATCGGAGTPGVCGVAVTYSDGYFVRDYDATGLCPDGTGPIWRLYSWTALTPGDSRVEFFVQTAATSGAIPTAPTDALVFSNPPGPVALLNQPGVAHAVNVPAGSPDTQVGAASPDYTLSTNGRTLGLNYLRVTAHLVPTSNQLQAPTLTSWNMQIDCLPNQ